MSQPKCVCCRDTGDHAYAKPKTPATPPSLPNPIGVKQIGGAIFSVARSLSSLRFSHGVENGSAGGLVAAAHWPFGRQTRSSAHARRLPLSHRSTQSWHLYLCPVCRAIGPIGRIAHQPAADRFCLDESTAQSGRHWINRGQASRAIPT